MRRGLVPAAALTVAFGVAQYGWPGHRRPLAALWLGGLAAIAIIRIAGAVCRENPTAAPMWRLPGWPGTLRLRSNRRRSAVADLAHIEAVVAESLRSAGGVHRRLRPLARDIARERLAMTHGFGIDAGDGRVQRLVGDPLWQLIRPDRPPPADAFGPGLTKAELAAIVDGLEELE